MMGNGSQSAAVSIFGLGKLGAVIAGCYASRGIHVIGVDVIRQCVEKCMLGIPPVQEPGIEDLYASTQERLSATTNGVGAVLASQVTLIAVPTPSEADGEYSLEYVLGACRVIADALSRKDDYHLVVLKSTVLPGACNGKIVPLLESLSGKRCGEDFGFCYNPEFIALGSVIHNIFNPDLTLIGESDARAGKHLLEIYARILPCAAPTARMNLVNAEVTKLAVNTFVTMKISFANLLAALCERLPGGDIDSVTAALGQDSRIGPKYLKGGLGFGGPCFPRDNSALLSLSRQLGVSFPLAEATDRANQEIPARVADRITSLVTPPAKIAVLGLSYKPDTSVIDESQAIQITEILAAHGFTISAYDPLAMGAAKPVLGDRVHFASSAQDCLRDAHLVVIATPWREFKTVEYRTPGGSSEAPLIVDCWGLLDKTTSHLPPIVRLGTNEARKDTALPGTHLEHS